MTNDYYGQALAVDWDLNNTLGFTSNFTTPRIPTIQWRAPPVRDWRRCLPGFNQNVQHGRTWLFAGNLNSRYRSLSTSGAHRDERGFKPGGADRVYLEHDLRTASGFRAPN